ncbi:MAG: transposase [Thermodesulfovibrionia bacterium]|nr:transposase [Thermodesulfovibrionia bacterium]
MPRIPRGLSNGLVYHVLNRGNGKQCVFHKDRDYKSFIDLMKEAKRRYFVKLFAYCLMPNHFHIILMPVQAEDLSKWMQWLMTSHVRRYHRYYGTSGHIWQGRFKSFVIQEDIHLLMALRYVEGNPVRAGLVRSAKDWPWSSHGEVIGERSRLLVDEVSLELPDRWDRYVNESITRKESERLHQSVNRQSPYGNPEWQKQISRKLGLESSIRPRGRPRKNKREYVKK